MQVYLSVHITHTHSYTHIFYTHIHIFLHIQTYIHILLHTHIQKHNTLTYTKNEYTGMNEAEQNIS